MTDKEQQAKGVEDISARRMQKLADENRELRQYVADVMQRLRANEQLFSRLFALESQVLKSTDPEDMCFSLLRGLRSQFDLDFVRFWFDRSSFMGNRALQDLSERDLVWVEQGEIEAMGLHRQQVCLLKLAGEHGFDWLMPHDAHLGSVALLTLGDLARPFGVLGLGSIDGDRFAPEQGTDFLHHLAQVIGLSLENAVAQERLARHAIRDSLTGTHNRRFLQHQSLQPLSQWFGKGCPVSCIYLDVDGFRRMLAETDDQGEAVLQALCECVRTQSRAQDPLIRVGDDEFVLLLPGCAEDKAGDIAARLLAQIQQQELAGMSVSVSLGLAHSAASEDLSVKQLIDQADKAMYVAKALGGGRVEHFQDD